MGAAWRAGNAVRLLENGDAFFPAVQHAIASAHSEILLETFILAEDEVGRSLRDSLAAAARRGVRVHITVDGYGSPDLSPAFIDSLLAAGVRLQVFDPRPRVLGMRVNVVRRMHRKIIVVDGVRAYVGGINFSVKHLLAHGERAKQDYAVELEGPVVADIRAFARGQIRHWSDDAPPAPGTRQGARGSAEVRFVVRDDDTHDGEIEAAYREAIRSAQREIVIANAFFIPGYRLLRDLRQAARRGVRVVLLVQGKPDQAYAIATTRRLYGYLAAAGVEIHEFEERAFHAKVAFVDEEWATVGSSNLDPLSLALNLEANVCVRDAAFNRTLRAHLEPLLQRSRRIHAAAIPQHPVRDAVHASLVFAFMRHFKAWARRLPGRDPAVAVLTVPGAEAGAAARGARNRWRWIGRVLAGVFFIALAVLLVRYARAIHWRDVVDALTSYDPGLLAATAGLAALSFLLYASYDLLARAYTGHRLPARRVLTIAAISYATNLNLGSLVGGAGFRYRLYSRAGLDPATITRIIAFSVTTNWLGYIALAGTLFATGAVDMPDAWAFTHAGVRVLGVVLLVVTAAYFLACAFWREREWTVRGHSVRLPSLRLAGLQLAVSAANWTMIGFIVYQLLQGAAPYATVLGAMLLAAIAGAMTHIPAGLGVLELVFLTTLDERLPRHTVLAALLAYRAIYYIGPLLLALLAYLRFEARASRALPGAAAGT